MSTEQRIKETVRKYWINRISFGVAVAALRALGVPDCDIEATIMEVSG